MEASFHYYGTYCAAQLAGYDHDKSQEIAYSAQLVDWCSRTFLARIGGPSNAATTQLKGELAQARTDILGLADITRIWSSFHFLPQDLYAEVPRASRVYRERYRLICGPNGDLLADTVRLAVGRGTQAAGLAMHVLADTWAHRGFAGTPSLVINNTNRFFVELIDDGKGGYEERPVTFRHSLSSPDDFDTSTYINTVLGINENSVMNLGHGRAGHLPDYSFARYRYVPAWANYEEVLKDNPAEYYQAFCQMVYALMCLRGEGEAFELDRYATDVAAPHEERIRQIIGRRQPDEGACADWKAFGESLSGQIIDDFDLATYERAYVDAKGDERNKTFLGKFILAALAQKGMVVNRIHSSGNRLAGRSVDYDEERFAGIRDFLLLVEYLGEGGGLE